MPGAPALEGPHLHPLSSRLSDPVLPLPLGDKKGDLCSLLLLKPSVSVWLSATVLGRCGCGVGLLSVLGGL
jgi:hypothetical protein